MLFPLYDNYTPPEHPYIRASPAYSTVVQLYARSAQLDCAYTRFLRFADMSPLCLAGCDELETVRHIFVICPSFNHLRDEAANAVHSLTAQILHNVEVPLTIGCYISYAEYLQLALIGLDISLNITLESYPLYHPR